MMDSKTETIRNKLNEWGIKQQWLADQLGVSKVQLSKWLNGSSEMPDHMKEKAYSIVVKLPTPE